MKIPLWSDEKVQKAWHEFVVEQQLTVHQEEQFALYYQLLMEWNAKMDLTAITQPEEVFLYHFKDSLQCANIIEIDKAHSFVDIGSGAGFPGIPLLIKYPHLQGYLLEVNKKRLSFLETIMQELALQKAVIVDCDWRTFLRKTTYEVQFMVCRASLHTDELMRMFKPSSDYNKSLLIYWAGKEWQVDAKEKPYEQAEYSYMLKNKKRRLILFLDKNTFSYPAILR